MVPGSRLGSVSRSASGSNRSLFGPYAHPAGLIHLCGTTDHFGGAKMAELPARFWEKVEKTESCWLWTAGKYRNGYGAFWLGGGMRRAHRLAYADAKGTIHPGLELDHLCRVRNCVNPDHLEAVTRLVNTMRGERFGAGAPPLKTHCPRGHEYSRENAYVYRGRRQCRECKRRVRREWWARKRAK